MPFGSTRIVFFKGLPPTYLVSPTVTTVNEGSSVTFNVITTGVPTGATLYWTVEGTGVEAADFTGAAVSGSFTIDASGNGSVLLTLVSDSLTEGAESFLMRIRTDSTAGPIVATSVSVIISDTSVTPLPTFANGGFETGDLTNWTVYNQQVSPGGTVSGKTSSLLGCPIPADPTNAVSTSSGPSPGQASTFTGGFTTTVITPGYASSYAVKLTITGGTVGVGGQTVYGPAIVSNAPAIAEVGDRISFWWTAQGGGDAYNVFAYAINPADSCKNIILLDATGGSATATTPWTQVTRVIGPGEAGNYYFIFICGTFDYTFGRAVGATLSIDSVQMQKAGTY